MRTIRLTATLFLLALAVQARAADLALVISNQSYANAPEVGRVAANGTRLAELLEERGYRVVTGENLDRAAMQATLERFALSSCPMPSASSSILPVTRCISAADRGWPRPIWPATV